MTSQISTLKSFQVNRAFRFDWKSASEKPCSKSRLGNQRHSWAQFGTETRSFVNLTPSACPTSRKENRETLWNTGPPDWSANACGTVNFVGSRWGATRATGGLCGGTSPTVHSCGWKEKTKTSQSIKQLLQCLTVLKILKASWTRCPRYPRPHLDCIWWTLLALPWARWARWAWITWRFQVERFVACGPEATAQTHTPPITTSVLSD